MKAQFWALRITVVQVHPSCSRQLFFSLFGRQEGREVWFSWGFFSIIIFIKSIQQWKFFQLLLLSCLFMLSYLFCQCSRILSQKRQYLSFLILFTLSLRNFLTLLSYLISILLFLSNLFTLSSHVMVFGHFLIPAVTVRREHSSSFLGFFFVCLVF